MSFRPRLLAAFASATLLAFGAAAHADPADPALAIARDADALAWGPCPAFLPAGCQIAVLHGDPSKGNADVFFKVPGGAHIPLHWHSSAERMVLVAGRLEVTYAGQPAAKLTPGMYAYGPPKVAHEARCAAGDDCVLFIAFEGPLDAFAGAPDAEAEGEKAKPDGGTSD